MAACGWHTGRHGHDGWGSPDDPLLLAGCSGIGPGTVTRDCFNSTAAVAESWKSQMFLNLVKMRYGDTPVFLDVGQIVTGYTRNGAMR